MRRIAAPAVRACLAAPDSPGATERERALAHFRSPDLDALESDKKTRFEFVVYSRKDVREALTAAFADKCAYCETRIDVSQPTAVEHFRPKGGTEREGAKMRKPGYWWLACA